MPINTKAAPGVTVPATRPSFEVQHPQFIPTPPSSQDRSYRHQSAFRASPDAWPGVNFLHRDPLGDDKLFIEPELYRVFLDDNADRPRVEYGGLLPPATIDRLAFIVADLDFGIVLSPTFGEGGYAVMRVSDFEAILGLGDGPMTWAAPDLRRRA